MKSSTKRVLLCLSVALGLGLWLALDASSSSEREEGVRARAQPAARVRAAPGELREALHEAPRVTRRVLPTAAPEASPTLASEDPPEQNYEATSEDPLEYGDSRLALRLVRDASDEPLESFVWLYRLDAPDNEFYERGDQLQAQLHVPREGLTLERLPEGLYRAICWEQLEQLEDTPAFEVSGDWTEAVLRLGTPRVVAARVLLYDELGARVDVVERLRITSVRRDRARNPWLARRWPKEGEFVEDRVHVAFDTVRGQGFDRLEADADGFVLTQVRSSLRGGASEACHVLGWIGCNEVEVYVSMPDEKRPLWAGLLISKRHITRALWLQHGERPDPARLTIDATCVAALVDDLPASTAWTGLSLEVRVAYPEHEALEFEWTPASGELADQFLVPSLGGGDDE